MHSHLSLAAAQRYLPRHITQRSIFPLLHHQTVIAKAGKPSEKQPTQFRTLSYISSIYL
jgi:hypothetical protein